MVITEAISAFPIWLTAFHNEQPIPEKQAADGLPNQS